MSIFQSSLVCCGFLCLALLLWQKSRHGPVRRCLFFGAAFSAVFLLIGFYAADYFTGNGIDSAVIFHLRYGLHGAGFAEYSGLIVASFTALLFGASLLGWHIFRRRSPKQPLNAVWSTALVFISFLFNPGVLDTWRLINGVFDFEHRISQQAAVDTDFSDYYHNPRIEPGNGNGKNVVFIYAESLERSYFDEKVFPGLMPNLKKLEKQAIHFTNIRQVMDTGWTVAGMTASQCGLPLVTPSHGNSMNGMDSFMQSAVCLGDLLSSAGYYLSYMAGADPAFSGKGKFYQSHGFDRVRGTDDLLPKLDNPEYLNSWGLYDDSLFELAWQHFEELAQDKSKQPFGLFTLTLDTHHPAGHPTSACEHIRYQNGDNEMLNAVACADFLINRFINKLRSSPYASNTVIVLVSDHLALANKAADLLEQTERRNLFMMIDPAAPEPRRVDAQGSTLDIGSTLLPLIGFDEHIGLGRNLLDKQNRKDVAAIHERLPLWKTDITRFWDFPTINHHITIDLDSQKIRIDQRNFDFPALVEINDRQKTVLRFDFDRNGLEQKALRNYRLEVPFDRRFILVDECRKLQHFDRSLGWEGFCLIAGKGARNLYRKRLTESQTFDIKAIEDITTPPTFIAKRIYNHNASAPAAPQSLQQARQQGFDYFAVDIDFDDKGKTVCRSYAEKSNIHHNCSLAQLGEWMQAHKELRLVAQWDLDDEALNKAIHKNIPDAFDRIIFEITNPYNFFKLKEKGYARFIWRLPPSQTANRQMILAWASQFDMPFAIRLEKKHIDKSLLQTLERADIPIYIHSVNKKDRLQHLKQLGATEIYTSRLAPL